MKQKIVLMKSVKHNYVTAMLIDDKQGLDFWTDSYAQLSEVIEVDFKELRDEIVIKSQVAIIDRQITKVMADSEASITALNGRKQELLALTCDSNE